MKSIKLQYFFPRFSGKDILNLLKKSFQLLFEGSSPKPHDLSWSKGQICIAYYECDKNWYRGKVVSVSTSTDISSQIIEI